MGSDKSALRRWVARVGLAAVLVGVPLFLAVAFGWPLPRGVPAGDEVSLALRDPSFIPDRFWWGVPVVIGWLAWLQLAGACVVELVARAGHRPTPAVPALVGPARRLAARWVSSAALVGVLVSQRPAVAHTPLPTPPASVAAPVLGTAGAPSWVSAPAEPGSATSIGADITGPAAAAAPAWAAEASGPVYVVQPWQTSRDCLWTIAERHLGDPMRWREIWELNRARPQLDGGVLEDPDLILDGWFLELPADAAAVPSAAGPSPAASPPPGAPSPPPESVEDGAADDVSRADQEAAPPVVAVPPPAAVDVAPPPSASPVTSAPPPSTPPASVPPVGSPTPSSVPSPAPARSRAPDVRPVGFNRDAMRLAAAAAVGLPLLAAGGIVWKLARRRRVQVALHRPGRDIVHPDPELEPLELKLRAIAVDQAAEWVDAAVRALVGALRQAGAAAPEVVCVRAGELGLEVLLAEPSSEAPEGFDPVDGGYVWRLDASVDLAELSRRAERYAAACPGLVSVGASPEGPLLADLETLGTLAVEGDDELGLAFLAGAALELASAPWAQGIDLRVLGGPPSLRGIEGVTPVDDLDALVDELGQLAAVTSDALGTRSSTLAARLESSAAEDWPPTVVIVASAGASPSALAELARLAEPGRGIALAAPGPIEGATWRLSVVAEGFARLEPLGLDVRIAGVENPVVTSVASLDADAIAGAASLLSAASHDEDVAPLVEIGAESARAPRRPRRARHDVWVEVLGPVQVSGWAQPIGRKRKLAELVTYLAMHPERPVPGDRLRAAVWPETDVSYRSFTEAVSRVRRHLGADANQNRHLPESANGGYHLGPGVGSDWGHFKELSAAATRAAPAQAMKLWREALELVRGEPFTGIADGTYVWAWSELLVHEMQVAINKAADALGALALAEGDIETASWAAGRGLMGNPTQLSLFDLEMHVAAYRRDPEGLRTAFHARRKAQQVLDPLAEVPPETVQLYERLMSELRAKSDESDVGSSRA